MRTWHMYEEVDDDLCILYQSTSCHGPTAVFSVFALSYKPATRLYLSSSLSSFSACSTSPPLTWISHLKCPPVCTCLALVFFHNALYGLYSQFRVRLPPYLLRLVWRPYVAALGTTQKYIVFGHYSRRVLSRSVRSRFG